MNIPLDRLYHYIQNLTEKIYDDCVIIYRFFPHGSKNITNLTNLVDLKNEWADMTTHPMVWCNDQEPLNYEYYAKNLRQMGGPWAEILKSIGMLYPVKNLNHNRNFFEKNLLLHSEKRSKNLDLYKQDNELIPVYYWSHGLIARDWFRFAEHESFQKDVKKTFLVYNRAWSGTREYRLKFAELIVRLGLENHCLMNINPIEPELGLHYDQHKFINPIWRPTQVIENYFPINNTPSHYSADFDVEDYNSTDIEVVLETLFDDGRLHLTEKSLRPIACGQPFILAGTHGSLEYLRGYGFKTFGHVWDERYDKCIDPEERLGRVADLMRQIANWTPWIREQKLAHARRIADYNRQHFFSQEFFDLVINELKANIKSAFDELESSDNYQSWLDRWNKLLTFPEVVEFLEVNQNLKLPTKENVDFIINVARQKLFYKNNQ